MLPVSGLPGLMPRAMPLSSAAELHRPHSSQKLPASEPNAVAVAVARLELRSLLLGPHPNPKSTPCFSLPGTRSDKVGSRPGEPVLLWITVQRKELRPWTTQNTSVSPAWFTDHALSSLTAKPHLLTCGGTRPPRSSCHVLAVVALAVIQDDVLPPLPGPPSGPTSTCSPG